MALTPIPKKTIFSKADESSLLISDFIKKLSEKHNVPQEKIMIGFVGKPYDELFIWEFDTQDRKLDTLEVIEFGE
jgi:hypothetical protein